MLVAFVGLVLVSSQDLSLTPPRPAVQCATHMTNAGAMRNCLSDLLDTAEGQLETALEAAREEAAMSDLDSGSMFDAAGALERAHAAWTAYRDAECSRRGSLMFISEDSREQLVLDCQISLTRQRTTELQEM